MNLRDMHYLVAVAELRSFSKAAEFCHVSQPTLSAQVKKLEELLGVRIFERSNKKVLVTPVGEKMVEAARRLLREEAVMRELAAHAHDPYAGEFRLGAFPTLASYLFPALVPAVKKALPKLKLLLVEEKTDVLVERLGEGGLDAALLALPVFDDRLVSRRLFDDRFLLAVPEGHALAVRKEVRQRELEEHKLLLLEEGHCLREQALDVCRLTGAEEQEFRATSLETLRQMVKAGTGVTLMPEIAVRKEAGIIYVPFVEPAPYRTIGLVWRKTSARGVVMERLLEIASV